MDISAIGGNLPRFWQFFHAHALSAETATCGSKFVVTVVLSNVDFL